MVIEFSFYAFFKWKVSFLLGLLYYRGVISTDNIVLLEACDPFAIIRGGRLINQRHFAEWQSKVDNHCDYLIQFLKSPYQTMYRLSIAYRSKIASLVMCTSNTVIEEIES